MNTIEAEARAFEAARGQVALPAIVSLLVDEGYPEEQAKAIVEGKRELLFHAGTAQVARALMRFEAMARGEGDCKGMGALEVWLVQYAGWTTAKKAGQSHKAQAKQGAR